MKIGILGGIGPEATGEFYNKLIKKLQTEGIVKQNIDYPQIIINSLPAPELIHEKVSKDDLLFYKKGLKELDKHKPDLIVIVCNTIHLYQKELKKEIESPIMDLRDELKKELLRRNIKKITVLGTPTTIKKLYKFKEIRSNDISKKEMKILSDAVFNFNIGIEREKQRMTVTELAKKYLKKGAETIVLGCTEMAVMLEREKIPKINTMDLMVDKVVDIIKQNL